MIDSKQQYLEILSKVMRSSANLEKSDLELNYNKLYNSINFDFKEKLQGAEYPNVARVIGDLNATLQKMEIFGVCPEAINNSAVYISNYTPSNLCKIFQAEFKDGKFILAFSRFFSTIPCVFFNSKQSSIEIINFANVRVKLSLTEYEILIKESNANHIALNKIVKIVIVKTPLTQENTFIIFDNIFNTAKELFEKSIRITATYLDRDALEKADFSKFGRFNFIIVESFEDLSEAQKEQSSIKIIEANKAQSILERKAAPIYYGFSEMFELIAARVECYYTKQYYNAKTASIDFSSDKIKMDGAVDDTFNTIKIYATEREKKLKKQNKEISFSIEALRENFSQLIEIINDKPSTGKIYTRETVNNVFNQLFMYSSNIDKVGKFVLSKLISFEYKDHDLVSSYIMHLGGNAVTVYACPIEPHEWEKAKMYIELCKLDDLPKYQIEQYVRALKGRYTTGKEFFAKARIEKDGKKRIELLIKSYENGYKEAGEIVIREYKSKSKFVTIGHINKLALLMNPEASLIFGKHNCSNDKSAFRNTYLKIAASTGYFPAISEIAKRIYSTYFSKGIKIQYMFQYRIDGGAEIRKNGEILCKLCDFLISKGYQVAFHEEMLGVTLYCMDENLPTAMKLLKKCDSGVAYYCIGSIYESGAGVSRDYTLARDYYNKALKQEFNTEFVQKRLDFVTQRIEKEKEFEKSNSSNDSSYESSYEEIERTTYNDSCLTSDTKIMLANGGYKPACDIEIGDRVLVFDHYQGKLIEDIIIANVHQSRQKKLIDVITMEFSNNNTVSFVKSHSFFDLDLYKYVTLNSSNIFDYYSHSFVFIENGRVESAKLICHKTEKSEIDYYSPISRFHINVVANGILSMPPTPITLNIFDMDTDLKYDVSKLDEVGLTDYSEISNIVSINEYENLPCKYLKWILRRNKNMSISTFEETMKLFRE